MIQFKEIQEDNFQTIVKMKVLPEQADYVASNLMSLAEAWLYKEDARPYAIYNDDIIVGFIMFSWDIYERTVGIWRLMIDPQYQNKGYGREAMKLAIQMVIDSGDIDLMYLDYVPGNDIAKNLYYSIGFRETGEIIDGEVLMTMKTTDKPKVGCLTADLDDIDDIKELFTSNNLESIPELKLLIENKQIERLTLYGETIGIAYNDLVIIDKDHSSYQLEANEILSKYRQIKKNKC